MGAQRAPIPSFLRNLCQVLCLRVVCCPTNMRFGRFGRGAIANCYSPVLSY